MKLFERLLEEDVVAVISFGFVKMEMLDFSTVDVWPSVEIDTKDGREDFSFRPAELVEFIADYGTSTSEDILSAIQYKLLAARTECKDLGFGIFSFDGVEYALREDACMSNYKDTVRYYAYCVANGKNYQMSWKCLDSFLELEDASDESYACDWECPVAVEEI